MAEWPIFLIYLHKTNYCHCLFFASAHVITSLLRIVLWTSLSSIRNKSVTHYSVIYEMSENQCNAYLCGFILCAEYNRRSLVLRATIFTSHVEFLELISPKERKTYFCWDNKAFFLKIRANSHSSEDEMNVELKNSWHYLWLCHSTAIPIYVHVVMSLVTPVTMAVSGCCNSEVCLWASFIAQPIRRRWMTQGQKLPYWWNERSADFWAALAQTWQSSSTRYTSFS